MPAAIAEGRIAIGWWNWEHVRLRAALGDFREMPAEGFLDRYDPGA
ncbi:hypothetical protein [Aliiruegeria sabulilitoris]|nr:hypothetical protein [Aliiruegeria sabulilitoris]